MIFGECKDCHWYSTHWCGSHCENPDSKRFLEYVGATDGCNKYLPIRHLPPERKHIPNNNFTEENNMVNQFIRFVERNVDGCGSDAEVVVLLVTDLPLTRGYKKRLEHEIESIKREWEGDAWDTDAVVEEAIACVFGEDVVCETVLPSLEVEF